MLTRRKVWEVHRLRIGYAVFELAVADGYPIRLANAVLQDDHPTMVSQQPNYDEQILTIFGA